MTSQQTQEPGNWKNVLKIIIPYIVISTAFQMVAHFMFSISYRSTDTRSTWDYFITTLFSSLGGCLTLWLFKKYMLTQALFHLPLKQLISDICNGLLLSFFMMLAGFILLLSIDQIQYVKADFIAIDFLWSIFFFLLVAFIEELLMRGYVLSNLMASMNKYLALVISSALFSIMHMANPNFDLLSALELFIAGLVLGLSYIYTRNLWFPIALHFGWNFFQGTIFGFNVSGIDSYSVIQQSRIEDNLWNGGAFGFEGSLLSIPFELLSLVIVYLLFRNRTVSKKTISLPTPYPETILSNPESAV